MPRIAPRSSLKRRAILRNNLESILSPPKPLVTISDEFINHSVRLKIDTIQGTRRSPLSLASPEMQPSSKSKAIKSLHGRWREEGGSRFLELTVAPEVKAINPLVTLRSPKLKIPAQISLTHIAKGKAASFSNNIRLSYQKGTAGKILEATGFLPLTDKKDDTFHTTTGGSLKIDLFRDNSVPPIATLTNAQLSGVPDPDSDTVNFRLKGTAVITEPDATLDILRGEAAISSPGRQVGYTIRLVRNGKIHSYQLQFPEPGSFPIDLQFSARLNNNKGLAKSVNFTVAGDGVMPVSISNLGEKIEFTKGSLIFRDPDWSGFLPASGKVALNWKPVLDTGDRKLFFQHIRHC